MDKSLPVACTAFAGSRRLAAGNVLEVALCVKAAIQADRSLSVLVFNDHDGMPIDLNLSGGQTALRKRYGRVGIGVEGTNIEATSDRPKRGRGRPRLGVVAREVTLLPRHWDWLAGQAGGASVALRKLVEHARRTHAEADLRRNAQEATYRVMGAIAGDAKGFEEATRALFAGDHKGFARRTASWPDDIRDYLDRLAAAAFAQPSGSSDRGLPLPDH
ncbi:MAG: DUF2239 family protein [Dokdonella sp.]